MEVRFFFTILLICFILSVITYESLKEASKDRQYVLSLMLSVFISLVIISSLLLLRVTLFVESKVFAEVTKGEVLGGILIAIPTLFTWYNDSDEKMKERLSKRKEENQKELKQNYTNWLSEIKENNCLNDIGYRIGLAGILDSLSGMSGYENIIDLLNLFIILQQKLEKEEEGVEAREWRKLFSKLLELIKRTTGSKFQSLLKSEGIYDIKFISFTKLEEMNLLNTLKEDKKYINCEIPTSILKRWEVQLENVQFTECVFDNEFLDFIRQKKIEMSEIGLTDCYILDGEGNLSSIGLRKSRNVTPKLKEQTEDSKEIETQQEKTQLRLENDYNLEKINEKGGDSEDKRIYSGNSTDEKQEQTDFSEGVNAQEENTRLNCNSDKTVSESHDSVQLKNIIEYRDLRENGCIDNYLVKGKARFITIDHSDSQSINKRILMKLGLSTDKSNISRSKNYLPEMKNSDKERFEWWSWNMLSEEKAKADYEDYVFAVQYDKENNRDFICLHFKKDKFNKLLEQKRLINGDRYFFYFTVLKS